MKLGKTGRGLLAAIMSAYPATALAHDGMHGGLGFADGLAHPFSGLDHIVLLGTSGVALSFFRQSGKVLDTGLSPALAGSGLAAFAVLAGSTFWLLIAASMTCIGIARCWKHRVSAPQNLAGFALAAALLMQFTSHFLARGDAPPQTEFAAGYAGGSALIVAFSFAAAYMAFAWWQRSSGGRYPKH